MLFCKKCGQDHNHCDYSPDKSLFGIPIKPENGYYQSRIGMPTGKGIIRPVITVDEHHQLTQEVLIYNFWPIYIGWKQPEDNITDQYC